VQHCTNHAWLLTKNAQVDVIVNRDMPETMMACVFLYVSVLKLIQIVMNIVIEMSGWYFLFLIKEKVSKLLVSLTLPPIPTLPKTTFFILCNNTRNRKIWQMTKSILKNEKVIPVLLLKRLEKTKIGYMVITVAVKLVSLGKQLIFSQAKIFQEPNWCHDQKRDEKELINKFASGSSEQLTYVHWKEITRFLSNIVENLFLFLPASYLKSLLSKLSVSNTTKTKSSNFSFPNFSFFENCFHKFKLLKKAIIVIERQKNHKTTKNIFALYCQI
jgi:hypothetical protein